MEWNIHGMAGYGNYLIPVHLIMDTVLKIEPDVLVLLEFVEYAPGYTDLNNSLEKEHYNVYTTKYRVGSNGILIAVKNSHKSEKTSDEGTEYLEIKLVDNNFSVIGTRILTEGKYKDFSNRKKLFEEILQKQVDKEFVLLMDANNGSIYNEKNKDQTYAGEREHYNYQMIWREVEDERNWSLITPNQGGPYNGGKYSFVSGENPNGENYHTKEDHIISSFPKEKFVAIDYYWDFVNKANGYGDRTKTDILSDLIGLPDHGILVATLVE